MSGKAVRETLGFLGVVASLVFVGMEVRQNTVAARASSYQVMGNRLADMWESMAMDAEYAALARQVLTDTLVAEDLETWSEIDVHRAVALLVSTLRQFETTWRQVDLGLLDEAALTYFGNASPGVGGVVSANIQTLWPYIEPWMTPDFGLFIEGGFSPR